MKVAFTWYGDPSGERPGSEEHTQWFDMPQVPAVGDSVSVGDPFVPTMTVRRVAWCADVGDEHEGMRMGVPGQRPLDCEWHAEVWLDARP